MRAYGFFRVLYIAFYIELTARVSQDYALAVMKSIKSKLALTATAVMASQAHGAIVKSPTVGSGIKPPSTPKTTFDWDVDNDGNKDFYLSHFSISFPNQSAIFSGADAGKQFVAPGPTFQDALLKLSSGFVVGAVMTGGALFPGVKQNGSLTQAGGLQSQARYGGWKLHDTGYFGFKFTDNTTGIHYGWGEMTISGTPAGQGFEITQAYYDSTPGQSITVGAVPEPNSLALLALGALGAVGIALRRTQTSATD